MPLLFNIICINGDKMGRAGYQIISQKQQDDFQNNYTYAKFQTAVNILLIPIYVRKLRLR